jgi:hypothetical protein
MSTKIVELLEKENISALNMGAEIKTILIENAKKCKIKMKKQNNVVGSSAPWFDQDRNNTKNSLRKLGKQLKKEPCNKEIRNTLLVQKRFLKKLVANKKRKYKQNIVEKMSKSNKSQKEFWKLLDRLSSKTTNDSAYVSHNSLSNHFKTLLNSSDQNEIPPKSNDPGQLDYPITIDELKKASEILKPGKAVGVDNLSNEMLSCLVETNPLVLVKLFKLILSGSEVLLDWVTAYIVPIHKNGRKSDPSNYRGISLLSCLGKLFLSILNNRLLQFSIDHKILSESQLGFRKGNRTSDAHIIIHNLVNKYCHKNNTKLYSCFIDLSKAFDTVPRDILLKKLLSLGIKGNFFNIIRSIYSNNMACVKMNNKVTKPFAINQGVRQGCVLSPLLFNIFMSDLAKKLNSVQEKLVVDNVELNSLFWADDIVLLAKSDDKLTEMLNLLANYCKENKLTINNKKTKCLIFNKSGRLIRQKFFLNGSELENVRTYKYLGFVLTPSGEIKTGLQDLRDRALKSFQILRNKMGESFNQNVSMTISLFESMIKPILLYASDFWGCLKLPTNNPIETLHMRICKQILGVQKQTTNIGVLLELGKTPLDISCIKLAVKNWERIKKKNANSLLLASYNDAIKENLSWISGIKGHLEQNGMLSLFLNDYMDSPNFIHKKLYQTLLDEFHQNAFETIRNESSKLRTYALAKTEIGLENYLISIKNVKLRTQLTRFRLSNHNLMIEIGRHSGTPKDQRYCPFCHNMVETEIHFMLDCSLYDFMRKRLIDDVNRVNPLFQFYTKVQKFSYLLANVDRKNIAEFIYKSFELRTFLSTSPKRED